MDGAVVEIPVPDAPIVGGLTLSFVHWEGDVPAGQETADPLTLIANADKAVTAVFQQAEESGGMTDGNTTMCGACGNGVGMGMVMVLFGWLSLRLIGPRRLRLTTKSSTSDR